ncbi:DUF2199 domain-containing protein [Micromonospora sp. ZYX-F-536]|uniref:DUF2199 domain-containing protein n=1 Tax=Micromonospora sp. ZYX-F-536 TaxID=3457629 RepID=UPI004040B1A3
MSESQATCFCCGDSLEPGHPAANFQLPDAIAQLDDDELRRLVDTHTYVVLTVQGHGSYLRVILPVPLDDGRTVTFGVWVAVSEESFYRARDSWASEAYSSLRRLPLKGTTLVWGMRSQAVDCCQLVAAHVGEQVPGVVGSGSESTRVDARAAFSLPRRPTPRLQEEDAPGGAPAGL